MNRRIKELEAALKPFADIIPDLEAAKKHPTTTAIRPKLKLGDLIRAKEALGENNEHGNI